jgi:hypothetical protein
MVISAQEVVCLQMQSFRAEKVRRDWPTENLMCRLQRGMIVPTSEEIVRAARVAVDTNHPAYHRLSGRMCWDAVLDLLVETQWIHEDDRLNVLMQILSPKGLINAQRIRSMEKLREIPQGAILDFRDSSNCIHIMLSLGGGNAVGNKNNCIGVGHGVGWEQLDLGSTLVWEKGCILAPGVMNKQKRLIRVWAVPLPSLKIKSTRQSRSLIDRLIARLAPYRLHRFQTPVELPAD